ncbi:hypothetical protein RJ035_007044 [Blastomyces gilchristii]
MGYSPNQRILETAQYEFQNPRFHSLYEWRLLRSFGLKPEVRKRSRNCPHQFVVTSHGLQATKDTEGKLTCSEALPLVNLIQAQLLHTSLRHNNTIFPVLMASFMGARLRFIEAYSDGSEHPYIRMGRLIDYFKFNHGLDASLVFEQLCWKDNGLSKHQPLSTRGAVHT